MLCRRPSNAGRWQNMWEVPHAERITGEELNASAVRIAEEVTGLVVEPGREVLTIRHGVTRYRITLVCLEAESAKGRFKSKFYAEAKWLNVSELSEYPVSAPQRKLMTELADTNRLF